MFFSKILLAGTTVLSYVLAQDAKIAFTSVPAVAVAGSTYNITWGGGDDTSGVTVTLRKGDPNNLETIGVLQDNISRNWYLWTVSDSLEPASDYALQIVQGLSDINYSGLFTIVSGSSSSSRSASGSITSTASTNSSIPTSGVTIATGSMGNGTISHNMTTSLTTPRITTTTPATTVHSSTGSATSAGATTAETTSAPSSGAAAELGSSVALVMGLFAAVMCLS